MTFIKGEEGVMLYLKCTQYQVIFFLPWYLLPNFLVLIEMPIVHKQISKWE